MSFLQHQLTYHTDSACLFERIAHQPWAMFLDSGQLINFATGKPGSQYGRYDILVAKPFITFSTQGALTTICEHGQSHVSTQDPFQLVNNALAQYQPESCIANACDLPFTGGAVGYFGYDLARRLEKLASKANDTIETRLDEIPQMQVGIYDWAVVVDHRHKTAHLVSHGFNHKTREQWVELCALFDTPHQAVQASLGFEVVSGVTSNMDKLTYETAFNAIRRYIHEGDCYQVNLAQRFSAKVRGNAWVAYQKLREISPAPFMAYMNLGAVQVISGSPERFLQVMDGYVETRPIKGTRPRSEDITQDAIYANELQSSIKDKAENLMIVDLLRNDIGKNCKIGSVKADKLFQLQSFANVHHLVSIVTGELLDSKTAIDLLRGCFPGGSITGAPKLRAMQIIEELEPHRRGVYCGAIGYIGFDGNMDTNIAIRTALYVANDDAGGELSFYAGGGIVADSDLEKEYAETLDKASSLLKMLKFFSHPVSKYQ
ncbi:MAG: aminodeoxychorismate synthase component I [Methylotenera sp.]|nr:aminodeoxychorismate synthase component I [Methylotenera sp.]